MVTTAVVLFFANNVRGWLTRWGLEKIRRRKTPLSGLGLSGFWLLGKVIKSLRGRLYLLMLVFRVGVCRICYKYRGLREGDMLVGRTSKAGLHIVNIVKYALFRFRVNIS